MKKLKLQKEKEELEKKQKEQEEEEEENKKKIEEEEKSKLKQKEISSSSSSGSNISSSRSSGYDSMSVMLLKIKLKERGILEIPETKDVSKLKPLLIKMLLEHDEKAQLSKNVKIEKIDTDLMSQNAYIESEIRLKSYKTIEKIIKSEKFTKNLEYKSLAKKYKGRINILISQLTTSKMEVEKKTNEISNIIKESTKYEEVYYFLLLNIAKLIVNQGKAQVCIQPRSAFSYSNLALRLCKLYPALTEILLAQFNISCCFTIPKYISKSNPNYYKEMGFEEREESKTGYESTENYLDKMNGVIMLYAALIQTPTPRCIKYLN